MTGGGGGVQRMSKSDKEKQMEGLWKKTVQWNRDIAMRRERDVSSVKAQMAGMGMRSGSPQWEERIAAVNAELDKEQKEIQEGATMKSLRDYYAGEDARKFNAGAAAEAREKAREEYRSKNNLTMVSDGTRGGGTRLGRKNPRGGVSFDKQEDRYVQENLDKKIEEITGGDIDSSMWEFYENKFGTDLSEDPNKLSEAEKSRKKAEDAAKGGGSSGNSYNAGSMSPAKKVKNPWL